MYTQATCRNYRCTQTNRGMLRLDKTIRALLDSLNVLSILSTRFWVSFVSIKVIHTMHTSIYFVILILYFWELWPFGTYNPNVFSLKADVRRKCRSPGVRRNGLSRRKQRLNMSLDYLLELPTLTIGVSFFMQSLLFRYLDWNQSWMMQTAEVYDIQIDINSNDFYIFV